MLNLASVWRNLFGSPDKRASLSKTNPRDPALADWFGGGSNTVAGVQITPNRAMQLSAVYACVRILSGTVASLPMQVYRRTERGRDRAENHPLQPLLHYRPNPWQTSLEWREMQMGHLLLRGNAYSEIMTTVGGEVKGLVPLHPDCVEPQWSADNTRIVYRYSPPNGETRVIPQSRMLHIRGLGFNMLKGLSPIDYARETLGATIAMEQFGAAFFGNGANLGSIMEHPGVVGEDAEDRLRASLEKYRKADNAHKTLILEEGMKWRQIAVEPENAQFLESRGFQIEEIARLFGVPPHMIAHTSKDTSWGSGIEQQNIGYVTFSARPWLVRWEQAIHRDLIQSQEQDDFYVEFNVEGLLRGDTKSRAEYYQMGINSGWLAPNEAREKENMNPKDGLDDTWHPLNMSQGGEPAQDAPDNDGQDRALRALERVHQDQLARAFDRIVVCEVKALRRAWNGANGDKDEFDRRAARFYLDHKKFIARYLDGLMREADTFAAAHMVESVRQVKAAIDGDGLMPLLTRWDASRAAQLYLENADAALSGIVGECNAAA